jgi:hypothetical protein
MWNIRDQYQAKNGHTYSYSAIIVMHEEMAVIQNLRVTDENGRPANIKVPQIETHTGEDTPEARAHLRVHEVLDHLT